MKTVNIIGIGMNLEDLTARHLKIIEKADILVGGKRLLSLFADTRARKKAITKDIDAIIRFVKQEMKTKLILFLN